MSGSNDAGGKPRMSLYANLLKKDTGSDAPGTITSAPVVYKQNDSPGGEKSSDEIIAAAKAKLNAAALRFQPTKRPTVNTNANKPKNLGPRPPGAIAATQPQANNAAAGPGQAGRTDSPGDPAGAVNRQTSKTTIEDWTGDPDDDVYYQAEKRQRGGRKKRKKNKEREPQPVNWDDIYDPSRPNNYEEYKNSEEKIREIQDWKDRLYAHRTARRHSSDTDSDEEDRRPALRSKLPNIEAWKSSTNESDQFAPLGMSFAPPPNLNAEDSPSPPPPPATVAAPPPPPAEVPNDASGDDAYARRMRMSQQQTAPPPPPPQSLPGQPQADISRAPVRYNLPPPPPEIPASEAELASALQNENDEATDITEDEPRSSRPGQKGFAERLMSKYGWTKGSGLGAQGTGITSALRVQVEKQKRKPDSEGGGFVGPGGRGKIIGGKRQGGEQEGKFGAMSEVVVLRGMVDGLDLRQELGDGNLMQEIGEECGEKYGRVERVFIDQSAMGSVPVFVKFTSPLSALRAVNALEGRIFNGNTIQAKFYDKDRFDQGDYSN